MKINLISEWGNVVSNVRNNIVFEHRNQAYGAYFIRREYPRTMFFSLFVTIGLIASGVVALKVSQYLAKEVIEVVVPTVDGPVVTTVYDITPDVPPPTKIDPPKSTPPPKGSMFVAPVVSDDKDTISDTQPFNPELKPGKPDGVDTDTTEFIPDLPKGTGTVVAVDTLSNKVLDFVDVNPEFPGGIEKMYEFITAKLKYPQQEKENGVSGMVYLSFTVDKSGKIKDVVVERGVKYGPNLEKEAQRVIGLMPEWKPGIYKGQTVSVRYRMPINFVLR
ncbi:MAG: energy transducer TonB [Bacteroidia bacterium]